MREYFPKVRPPTPPPGWSPSLLPAAITGLLGVFGLIGATIKTVLDQGYALPIALYAAMILGLIGTMLLMYVLSWFTAPSTPGAPPPAGRA